MLPLMRVLLTTLHSKYIHSSWALPCLAAYCAPQGHDMLLREFTIHEPKETIVPLLLEPQPEVIGFSVYLWNRQATLELIDSLHLIAPHIRLVLGGPEVIAANPKLLQHHPGISAVVIGEGEGPLARLLAAWQQGHSRPADARGLLLPQSGPCPEAAAAPLADLDSLPSPIQTGWAHLQKRQGLFYYETSRGCPFQCAFCMSARTTQVRSFSMHRIQQDLKRLMAAQVPQVKLVDRTFNYDPARARSIMAFILQHNRRSQFHFELAAHLLDDATMELLAEVPPGWFHLEVGVQTIHGPSLRRIGRPCYPHRVHKRLQQLCRLTNLEVHLDLLSGLPGEQRQHVHASIDSIMPLNPHHLQIETVKLLPGSPLRQQAASQGMAFDPHPPYTTLHTPQLSFAELEGLRRLSRILDLTYNSHRGRHFLRRLSKIEAGYSQALDRLQAFFHQQGLLRFPLSQQDLFKALAAFCRQLQAPAWLRNQLLDVLAWDYALAERILPQKAPDFFPLLTTPPPWLESQVQSKRRRWQHAAKVQYIAGTFEHLCPDQCWIGLFFYITRSHYGMWVESQWWARPLTL